MTKRLTACTYDTKTLMRDSDVRGIVRVMLRDIHGNDEDTHIVEEMGIWSSSARIDIAVINGQLHGYELKSERDTLLRLPNQAAMYNQVFDKVTLVVAKRHLAHARTQIPKWWGLILVSAKHGEISLDELRRERPNPGLSPLQLARLLWRSEILEVLSAHGFDQGFKSKPLDVLARRFADVFSLLQIRNEVRDALKRRVGLRQLSCDNV